MRTIELRLPNDLDEELRMIDENQEEFILHAIRESIKAKALLRQRLVEGYQATYKEDLSLTSDFEGADLEDWK